MMNMEELINELELGRPAFDGADVNFNVATIEDAITIIKKYAEIMRIIEEFYAAPDCHWGRGNPRDSMAESFERILNIVKEVE